MTLWTCLIRLRKTFSDYYIDKLVNKFFKKDFFRTAYINKLVGPVGGRAVKPPAWPLQVRSWWGSSAGSVGSNPATGTRI
jgi:hypothetical protein